MLKHSITRRAIVMVGVIIPLLLGVSGCSVDSKSPAAPTKTTSATASFAGKFDAIESPAAAKMYENYLNKLYTTQASEIQATIDPLVADGELSKDDTTQLVANLKTSFPELFGAFDIKDLTDDQAATLFYSVFSLTKTFNDENITAVITVPPSAILIEGKIAQVNAKQVVAKSEDSILSLGETPVKVELVKIDGEWFIIPPAAITTPTK